MLRVSTVVRLMPDNELIVVSETMRVSALVTPASKESVLSALRVTSESAPTSVSLGKLTALSACRILSDKDSEMLTKLGALMLVSVVMLEAVRLPSMDVTPFNTAVVMGEARIMSPSKVEQSAMVSRSDCDEAVSVVEQTSTGR